MYKVKISMKANWPLLRQTPQSKGVWGDYKFYLNEDIKECDYWVVYDGLKNEESTICPKKNTILITGEPPSVKKYNDKFLNQFSTIITCHRDTEHKNVKYYQQALPWNIGRKIWNHVEKSFTNVYDDMENFKFNKKKKLISIISSSKLKTEGHKNRVEFLNKIKKYFGNKIDIFGHGINDIEDKWDAIYPYKYHIVLENGSYKDYWSEKLADTFLTGTYPIYYGCTNINDYFPKNSLSVIDINNFEESIKIIEETIKKKEYENKIKDIYQARELILEKYNIFPMLINFFVNKKGLEKKDKIIIKSEEKLKKKNNKIKSFLLTKLKK